MKIICLTCGKKTRESYCKKCGLYNKKMDFDIIEKLHNIETLLTSYNKKIRYYKIRKNNEKIIFYTKGLYSLFNWIYDDWINLNLEEIDSFRCLLSYLQNDKSLNISEFALLFFGFLFVYNSEFKKYYEFWKKKAIKTGSYLAIQWAINDLEVEGKKSSKFKKISNKLSTHTKER